MNVRKPHSEETKRKMSESHKGKAPHWKTGGRTPMKTRIKMSCSKTGIPIEKWNGFAKQLYYCEKFDEPFKERVRNFFGRICVECGKTEEENGRRLDVHHVNNDKQTCCNPSEKLFVCLCKICHNKTKGKDKNYWRDRFRDVIHFQYGGRCYLPKQKKN